MFKEVKIRLLAIFFPQREKSPGQERVKRVQN